MKKDIHPKYEATVYQCACGNRIETRGSMGGTVQVDICSGCHPFFTGKQKLIDTAGRIDRFKKKFGESITSSDIAKRNKESIKPEPAAKEKATAESKPFKLLFANAKKKKEEADKKQ